MVKYILLHSFSSQRTHRRRAPRCLGSTPRSWWQAPRVYPTPPTNRTRLNRCPPARDCCPAPVSGQRWIRVQFRSLPACPAPHLIQVLEIHLRAIVCPWTEFHETNLLIVGKVLDIHFTRWLVNSRRLPENFPGVLQCGLCHQRDLRRNCESGLDLKSCDCCDLTS